MSIAQRIIGYTLLAVGVASIFVGASPLFPIGLEAFLIGTVFLAAGAWVLAGRELRATVRRLIALRMAQRRGARRGADRGESSPADPLLPVRILRLAKDHAGVVTLALVAMALDVPLDQAEAGLSACVRAGNAVADYDVTHGHASWRFPEFLPPEQPRLPT
jgi:hypothetical protein